MYILLERSLLERSKEKIYRQLVLPVRVYSLCYYYLFSLGVTESIISELIKCGLTWPSLRFRKIILAQCKCSSGCEQSCWERVSGMQEWLRPLHVGGWQVTWKQTKKIHLNLKIWRWMVYFIRFIFYFFNVFFIILR